MKHKLLLAGATSLMLLGGTYHVKSDIALKSYTSSLETTLSKVDKQYSESLKTSQKLKFEFSELHTKYDQLEQNNNGLKSKIKTLEKQNTKLKREVHRKRVSQVGKPTQRKHTAEQSSDTYF